MSRTGESALRRRFPDDRGTWMVGNTRIEPIVSERFQTTHYFFDALMFLW